jgi:mono/diheme cytochrome c family protein
MLFRSLICFLLGGVATLMLPVVTAAPVLPPARAYGDLSQARIEHGRYLTLAGDCLGCHQRPGGQAFEGGLALDTPFGTIYTPNITPDAKAGIGAFNDQDFLRALQHGIRPDGQPYYPALPYPSFTKVKDDDLLAIKDYLFSLEPSDYRPPETRLRWPFDLRDLLFGWQELFLRDQSFQPDSQKSVAWNRGAYLVEGLGHCRSCHGSPALTATIDAPWLMPAMALTALADRDQKTLMRALRAGTNAPDAHRSLPQLADSDLRAIAIYLQDQPPPETPAQTPEIPHQLSEQDEFQGRRLYKHYCVACHQSHGQGRAPYFPALRGNEVVTLREPNDVINTLLLGAPADPTQAYSQHVVMPSFGTLLTDHQLAILASYIRANWGNDAAPVTAEQVAKLRQAD